AGLLLQQSVAWVVRSRDGAPYDESTPPDSPELVRSAVEGETIARELGERHGFDVGVLRAGVFYGPEDAGTRAMADALRKRRLPVLGRGDSVVAPVHVEDVVAAFVAAVEVGRAGTWHVVDDRPLPMAEWLSCFADVLGAPRPRGVPLWLGRLLLGPHVVESMTTSMRTTNARLRSELGWEPRYPTVREGLEDAVRRWAAHGGLQPPMIPLRPAATASPR
ncbi:MAG TPA: NAD-dependent epimerase/dehydratase family protein, partial [Longimicrobiales bacterium]|nr:NAD-dependent epimerase/dehydratase family protein [Longimicrobiales bacterium]